jgi:hypothetical protein
MKARRGSRGIAVLFIQPRRHDPAALPLGKTPGTHCIVGWVGPRAGADGCGKAQRLIFLYF